MYYLKKLLSYPVVELNIQDLVDFVDSLFFGHLLILCLLGLLLLLYLEVGVDQILATLRLSNCLSSIWKAQWLCWVGIISCIVLS